MFPRMTQQESESLSANVRLGLQFRYQQGKVQVNHNWFLGYTKDADGHLIIDPEQDEVVKRIYMKNADVSDLNAQCVLALIMGAVRAERFCDGALLDFFKSGCILKWLERLNSIE